MFLWQFLVLTAIPAVLGAVQNQCILLPLPLSRSSFNGKRISPLEAVAADNTTSVIAIDSELQYSAFLHYVSNVPLRLQSLQDTRCSDIVGVIGDIDSETVRIIHSLSKTANSNTSFVSVVAPTTFKPLVNVDLPKVLDMNPLIHYTHTLSMFVNQLNWTRVGLITDGTSYYQSAAELLQIMGIDFIPYVRWNKFSTSKQVLQVIREYETRVVIILMKKTEACSLLQEAQRMNFIWPSYGWLVLDADTGVSIKSACSMEGVVYIKDLTIEDCEKTFTNNTIASSLYTDAIRAATSANINPNFSFVGEKGLIQFRNGNRLNNVSVVQLKGGSDFEIAHYDSATQQLTFFVDIIEFVTPRGTVLSISNENPIEHTILFAMLAIMCALFVTVILILYIAFRNEPEIKATSVSVSLSMFVACYLLLALIPVTLVKAYPVSKIAVPSVVTCQLLAWLSGVGIPFPLILATLLVKMLRVYSIFQKPLTYKKRFCTDYFLLLYIVLLISPNLLILISWSSIDTLIILSFPIPLNQGEQVIIEVCLSTHTTAWLTTPYVYMAVLIVAIIVVGFKTLNVRYKHFKDTGATNFFVFIAIAIAFTGNMYSYIFAFLQPNIENYRSGEMSLNIANLAIVMSCQLLLFVPKIYFPFKRWFYRNEIKKKPAKHSPL